MFGEEYPPLTGLGALLLESLVKAPAGATMLAEQGRATNRKTASSALSRFYLAGLVEPIDKVPKRPRDRFGRKRAGPPQQLYQITKEGRAALAAHRAAVKAFEQALR